MYSGRLRRPEYIILRSFGLADFNLYLSTRPEKSVGAPELWEHATAALRAAMEKAGPPYTLDEGGGAFYGPKIDLKQKIPYMLVIGDKEAEAGQVARRLRSGENPGPMPVEEFVRLATEAVERREEIDTPRCEALSPQAKPFRPVGGACRQRDLRSAKTLNAKLHLGARAFSPLHRRVYGAADFSERHTRRWGGGGGGVR